MSIPPLPTGSTLLHIGLPKTGTTALQSAAAATRSELLGHGVCYPGRAMNHREPVLALLGRRLGWSEDDGRVPPPSRWEKLVEEIGRTAAPRTLVSHEFCSEADPDQIAALRTALGPELSVVVTLRPFASVLASSWQQGVKAGRRQSYDRWLRAVLKPGADTGPDAHPFYARHDQGAIVSRFADVLGPDRVIVIVVDKERPTLLTDTFEQLLALPAGILARSAAASAASNRSLSWPEAELIRAINVVARKNGVRFATHDRILRRGGVRRLMDERQPAAGEEAIVLPDWAGPPAAERAARYVEQIAASHCAVVGDLDQLRATARTRSDRVARPTEVPFAVAVELASGLLSASVGQGSGFDVELAQTSRRGARLTQTATGRRVLAASDVTREYSVGDLLRVIGLRLASRSRR